MKPEMNIPVARKRSVAITGASSFTGFWIAQAFRQHDWTVHALFAQPEGSYLGMRGARANRLRANTTCHFNIRAEDGSMAEWIRNHARDIDIWVHHHHWMQNFKRTDYDLSKATEIGITPLPELIQNLKLAHCGGIINSATYFEQAVPSILPAEAQAYVQNKSEVRLFLTQLAQAAKLPLSSIFIPNPIGPLDNEDRFFTLLTNAIESGKEFKVLNPEMKTSLIPVMELAQMYVESAMQLLQGKSSELHPTGITLTIEEWVQKIRLEFDQKWKYYAERHPQIQPALA